MRFRVWGLGTPGSGFRVEVLGFRVRLALAAPTAEIQALEFAVYGLGSQEI